MIAEQQGYMAHCDHSATLWLWHVVPYLTEPSWEPTSETNGHPTPESPGPMLQVELDQRVDGM